MRPWIAFSNGKGKLTEYWGGYSDYREQKAQDLSPACTAGRSQRRKGAGKGYRRHAQPRRGRPPQVHGKSPPTGLKMGKKEAARARAKKMDKKVKNDVKRLQRMIGRRAGAGSGKRTSTSAWRGSAHGKRVLEAKDLVSGFGSRCLLKTQSFTLCRGDRAPRALRRQRHGQDHADPDAAGAGAPTRDLWLSHRTAPAGAGLCHVRGLSASVLQFLQQELGAVGGRRDDAQQPGASARHMNQRVSSLSFGGKVKVKLAVPMLRREDFLIWTSPPTTSTCTPTNSWKKPFPLINGTADRRPHDVYLPPPVTARVLYLNDERILPYPRRFSRFMAECLHFGKED